MYYSCVKVFFVLTAVASAVMSGSVLMSEVKLQLWKIVCFRSLGGCVCSVNKCNGCCGFCVCCFNCDASSFRWVLTGSTLVSSCKCWIFVSRVHPVAILRAAFWIICILFMLVCEIIEPQIVLPCSKGRVMALYV